MRRVSGLVLVAFFLVACGTTGGEAGNETPCQPTLLPGDLVITEIMVNPAGADDGLEWVEVLNASGTNQCINGLRISLQGSNSSKDLFVVSSDSVEMEAGTYAVFGSGSQEWLFHKLGDDFSMTNTSGTVSLRLGAELIDSVSYGEGEGSIGEPKEGKSLSLCGECKAANCNDDAEVWFVAAAGAYDAEGNLGTPGAANVDCLCNTPEGTAPPAVGDVAITEVFPNPSGPDGDREWFEILITADHAVDLAGVEVIKDPDPEGEPQFVIGDDGCIVGTSGQTLLLARSGNSAENGGVTPDYVYGSSLTLNNSGGYLALRLAGEIIAEAPYGSSEESRSVQLDPVTGEWCSGKNAFGDEETGGFGTPGAANSGCSAPTGCLLNGESVALEAPGAGDLEITEFFPNTPGNEDASREWFEVRNPTAGPIDLNGVELWKDPTDDAPETVLASADGKCLRVAAGETVVLARSNDSAVNGIPTERILLVYSSLTFNNSGYFGLHQAGVVIDSTQYGNSEDGKALQKDPVTGAFCDASSQYWTTPEGKEAFGTPGEANLECGVSYCTDGGVERVTSPPPADSIVITEVFANPEGTDSPSREWLEVYVTAAGAGYDLNGLQVRVNGSESGILAEGETQCVVADTGYWLLAGSDVPAENGGLPAVDVKVSGLTLKNSDVDLALTAGDTLIDSVEYTSTNQGVAWQLDSGVLSTSANDDWDNWCASPAPFNATPEYGTPGSANPSCDSVFCTTAANDTLVEVVPPPSGAMILTEVYANTPGADDTNLEWFEVYVPPEVAPFDLNGVGIVTDFVEEPAFVFAANECIRLAPGSHYVFCRNSDTLTNGGIGGCIEYGGISLKNSDGYLALESGSLLDEVPSYGNALDGISRSLSSDSYNTTANDNSSNWCDTPEGNTFGDGSVRGTPGMMNPACL